MAHLQLYLLFLIIFVILQVSESASNLFLNAPGFQSVGEKHSNTQSMFDTAKLSLETLFTNTAMTRRTALLPLLLITGSILRDTTSLSSHVALMGRGLERESSPGCWLLRCQDLSLRSHNKLSPIFLTVLIHDLVNPRQSPFTAQSKRRRELFISRRFAGQTESYENHMVQNHSSSA